MLTKVTSDVISTNTISGLISAGFTSMNVATIGTQTIEFGSSNTLVFRANPSTERMRIDNLGRTSFGTTNYGNSIVSIRAAADGSGQTSTFALRNGSTSASTATSAIHGFANNGWSGFNAAAPYTTTNVYGFSVNTFTLGTNQTVTNQYGFFADSGLTGATNNFGFYSNIASSTGRWNFYANGTANNYFAGNVGIAATAPAQLLHIGIGGANNYIQFGATNEGFVIGRENATGEFTFDATQASPYNVFKWRQSGTERMRIAADGNVGIGAVPITKLHIQGHNSDVNTELRIEHPFAGGAATAAIRFKRNSSDFAYMGGAALSISGGAVDDLGISVVSGKNIVFGVNAAERMRIDTSGNVFVGRTSNLGTSRFVIESDSTTFNPMTVSNSRSTTATDYSIIFYRNNNIVGSVQTSLSATSFVTASDYRLKENIAPMTGALAKVALLKPVTYDWKVGGSSQGFIAHELQAVVPDCVTGTKDAVDADGNIKPQGVDTSFLVATLTAAIQELKAEFDEYKRTHP